MSERILFRRVNKRRARALWQDGQTIKLQTCKYAFTGGWQTPYELPSLARMIEEESAYYQNFDNLVASYESYNCNWETGYYAHYYLQVAHG